ncbi:MAG: helix-turn-helix domain-containing protein [Pseudomonadota bacterium]
MAKANPFNRDCPSQQILALIGSKWSMLLMCILRSGPTRSGELARRAGGISQKMLTQTLRELARHGLIHRHDYQEVPPRVEYRLTRLGESLSDLIGQIEGWVTANYSRMSSVARTYGDASRAG